MDILIGFAAVENANVHVNKHRSKTVHNKGTICNTKGNNVFDYIFASFHAYFGPSMGFGDLRRRAIYFQGAGEYW